MNGEYGAHLRRHHRLAILRVLAEAPSYKSNESLLTQILDAFGLGPTRDQVRGEIAWLAEQGLARVSELGGLMIAEVTLAGIDVAAGRRTHPDVEKPAPKR